jgi:dihydrodipicolinate synthase/N-acetylneuraminate lyase
LRPAGPDSIRTATIDEASFRLHLSAVAATPGLAAATVNAHSTEVASCSFEEQRRVLDIAGDTIGDRLPLEALVLLGRLPRAVVRPPLVKLGAAEIDRIKAALAEAGLLGAKAGRDAAQGPGDRGGPRPPAASRGTIQA